MISDCFWKNTKKLVTMAGEIARDKGLAEETGL
jgi:hypothetical protein